MTHGAALIASEREAFARDAIRTAPSAQVIWRLTALDLNHHMTTELRAWAAFRLKELRLEQLRAQAGKQRPTR